MKLLDETDEEEINELQISESTIKSILKSLSEKKGELLDWQKQIEENNGEPVSSVDPGADNEHGMVVEFEVATDANDIGKLSAMTEPAKEILGVGRIDVSADKGYYDSADIARCERKRQKAGHLCMT